MADTEAKTKRSRSPNYPGIDLRAAVDRARQLYAAQRRHQSPVDVAIAHWGYQANSGGGLVVVAALKKFGLITEIGKGKQREVGLSELALDIIEDDRPESIERAKAITRAALMPPIHNEVWERYQGNLPDDTHLLHHLKRERGFTDQGAKAFIGQFRRTIDFANLAPSDSVRDEHEDSDDAKAGRKTPPPGGERVTPPGDTALEAMPIPLPTRPWGELRLPETMSEEAWDHMIRYLDFIKPSKVKKEEEKYEGYQDEGLE